MDAQSYEIKFNLNLLDTYLSNGGFTREKHKSSNLLIYGYLSGPFSNSQLEWNETTSLMRGLIVSKKGELMSMPFSKFFTFKRRLGDNRILASENQIIELPDEPFEVFEKVDGTFCILYWVGDVPYLATQRSFHSYKAQLATKLLHSRYKETFTKFNRNRTYIFEAIYPESRVIIDYGDTEELVLIGVIDNKSGQDLELENIGFRTAKNWTKELSGLSLEEIQRLNLKNQEGFVLRYQSGLRIKLKFKWYQEIHEQLDKIIKLEYELDDLKLRIRKRFNVKSNVPNLDDIILRFKNGETPGDIKRDFPYFYNYIAIDDWLDEQYSKFQEGNLDMSGNSYKTRINWREFIYKPFCENIMYKRLDKILRMYF